MAYSSLILSQMITIRQAFNAIILVCDPITQSVKIAKCYMYHRPHAQGLRCTYRALFNLELNIIFISREI
jgi:hypothetical protein